MADPTLQTVGIPKSRSLAEGQRVSPTLRLNHCCEGIQFSVLNPGVQGQVFVT